MPGTILRIFLPAGAVVNLFNLLELSSPTGVCLILRVPLHKDGKKPVLQAVLDTIKQAGGSVEVVEA